MSQQQNNDMQQHFYRASAADFGKIPGSPVAYWIGSAGFSIYSNFTSLKTLCKALTGMRTGDNERFLRRWHEVTWENVGINYTKEVAFTSRKKWFPYNKGGDFNKWYGNNELVVNWFLDGEEIKDLTRLNYPQLGDNLGWKITNESMYFRTGITWGGLTSSVVSFRWSDSGALFDSNKGAMMFPCENEHYLILGFLNSKVVRFLLNAINPTLSTQNADIDALPLLVKELESIDFIVSDLISKILDVAKKNEYTYETSWGFSVLPLLKKDHDLASFLRGCYQSLRAYWLETILEMQRLEEENNRLFIDAYGLQDELTPEVPLSEITLTCNPHYRYGVNLTHEEREARLQSDTIAELISYVIGCMMGRYSLDREGLVYAHAGNEGFKALVEEGAYATFAADEDGILPLTSDNWFPDDVAARIEQFVRTVWGAETLEENLQFIADSLCLSAIKPVKKGGETARETIRRYLSTQFFKDHMKTYKKRPIYWLFSSGKEKAFECLVYLHRLNESTLPRMRTEYVTPLLGQMAGRIERLRLQQAEAGTAEAKRIGKDIDSLTKQLTELRAFDDELKHHADMRIRLDLDDGVKVNYGKFGTLLSEVKAITGDKGE